MSEEKLIPITKVPSICGYTIAYLYTLIKKGFITKVKVGKHTFISTKDVEKLVIKKANLDQKEKTKKAIRKSAKKCRKSYAGKPDSECPAYIVNRRRREREKNQSPERKAILQARGKASYHKHKNDPKRKAYAKKYYEENKEHCIALQKEWAKKNADKVKAYKKKYDEERRKKAIEKKF